VSRSQGLPRPPALRRNQQFTLTAAYTEDSPLPAGCDRTIGTFTVGPPPRVPSEGEAKAKLKVKVRGRRGMPRPPRAAPRLPGCVSAHASGVARHEQAAEAFPASACRIAESQCRCRSSACHAHEHKHS
jgi:hypothetical protein